MKSLVFFIAMMVTTTFAFADSVTFDLTSPNDVMSAYPSPYIGVTVDRTSNTTATITFDSQVVGNYVYMIGDGSSGALNFNGAVTINSMVGNLNSLPPITFTGFDPASVASGGSGTVNGFGTFSNTFNNSDGFKNAVTQLVITVTNNSGTWANANDVLLANANEATAAAHVFVCLVSENVCAQSGGALATGFVSNGEDISVPEPATMLLLGTSSLGLAFLKRKKAKELV